jgi:histidinol dehydrogenase
LVCAASSSAAALDALAARLSTLAGDGPAVSAGGGCVLVQTGDPRQALALANAYGPEHLQLIGAQAEALAPLVQSAGCLFVGAGSATAFGDYVAGSNHVLPTAGAARFASGLSVAHFRRRMCEVRIGSEAAAVLSAPGAAVARSEGFEWHAASMEARGAGAAAVGARESMLS